MLGQFAEKYQIVGIFYFQLMLYIAKALCIIMFEALQAFVLTPDQFQIYFQEDFFDILS